MPGDNRVHLIDMRQRGEEEASRLGKIGAQKSAETRRRYKTQREILAQILTLDIPAEEIAEKLKALGLDPSVANAMGLKMVDKALKGSEKAYELVRDTLGEKPVAGANAGLLDAPADAIDMSALTDEQLRELVAPASE